MSIAGVLKQEAMQVAREFQNRLPAIEAELAQIEARRATLTAERDTIRLLPERTYNFLPEMSGDLQCPRCWIANEARSALLPIPGGGSRDILHCRICNFEFDLPT